jgi:hypothetical protein
MPHVLDETDILEYPSASSAGEARHVLSRGLPTSARRHSRFLTFLRCLFVPAPRLRTRSQAHCSPRAPRFETSLDILAREHPDSHLWVMAVIG